jgi:integrase
MWKKYNGNHATAYEFRHHYAVQNINKWTDEGFGFDAKLLYLSKSMGHSSVESTKYYYSLTPGLADVLQAHSDGETVIPEVTP